ncbi:MAG: hypothetical protein B6240_01300 [Desulfobacteraceae bacterium 4572_87]|nr:MAG: hypothetical protein B6240_01300 [Desulfobacteraceae bacterium 4572_87]
MQLGSGKTGGALWFILTLFFALAAGIFFSVTNPGRDFDGLFLDKTAPFLGTPRTVRDPLVILIGENDYSAAQTPLALWGTHLVPLLKRIEAGKPEAVGLDMILPRFPLSRIDRDHDKRFLRALNSISKRCRLISGYGIAPGGKVKEPFLLYQRLLGPMGYGYFNVTPDPDGVCRKQVLTLPSNKEGLQLRSFSWFLSGNKGLPPVAVMPDWRNHARIPTLTFQQALNAEPATFTDRVVIIGFDFDFEDRHPTPASMNNEAGVIFQARVVEALRSGKRLLMPSWPVSLLAGGFFIRPSAALISVATVCAFRFFEGHSIIRDTFGRYVSREVRDQILSGRIPLEGEMREVTMLFADLRDFTPMVERTPPRAVVQIVNRYFTEMSAAIREQKGLVLLYAGDQIVSVFGAPILLPDHSRRAVLAAVNMRSRLKIVNQSLARQEYPLLKHGIGIHTGPVLAGNIGGGDRVSYSMMGDTVNIASRLQGLNKKFGTEIIISDQTRAGIGKDIPVKQLPTTPIKGKSKRIDIFSVI